MRLTSKALAKLLGIAEQTVRNYRSYAERFPTKDRSGLTISHAQALTPLLNMVKKGELTEQRYSQFLAIAKNGCTISDLKKAIEEAELIQHKRSRQ